MSGEIQLPEELQKKYSLVDVKEDEAYFAHLGHIKYSTLTAYQAKWLVDNKSPHIVAVDDKPTKEIKAVTPKNENK